MPQRLIPLLASATVLALALFLIPSQRSGTPVQADVAGVSASAPFFAPGQPLTITVSAEDDDGTLTIISNDPESELTVLLCTGSGLTKLPASATGPESPLLTIKALHSSKSTPTKSIQMTIRN